MKKFLFCLIFTVFCLNSCVDPIVVQPVHHPFDRPVPHIVVPTPAPRPHHPGFFGMSTYQWNMMKTDSIKADTVKVDSIK